MLAMRQFRNCSLSFQFYEHSKVLESRNDPRNFLSIRDNFRLGFGFSAVRVSGRYLHLHHRMGVADLNSHGTCSFQLNIR